ncbi:MAG: hypothetical protein IPN34_00410 [Planctomycetes bacterium]|nr:hypothetical protein [Planctomycetota bacterium]
MARMRFLGIALLTTGSLVALTSTQDSAAPSRPQEPPPLAATDRWRHGHFATGAACGICHASSANATAMRDAEGRSVAPHDLWSATMMANSSRDPVWRAFVSAEVAAHPEHREHIETECMRCHAPMAAEEIRQNGGGKLGFALLYGSGEEPLTQLALDGASCTTCHQMPAEGLGDASTFSGRFSIGSAGVIYGPHENPVPGPMRMHVQYTPTHGPHVQRSALCASCHTLFTKPHDAAPEQEAFFPEQTPYLEWRNSVFDDERAEPSPEAQSCQGCHMPTTDLDGQPIETRLAHNPGGRDFPFLEPRAPFARHLLLGGNTLTPGLLRDFADELRPAASKESFERVIDATRQQLRERTAALHIDGAKRTADQLVLLLRVENRVGHKFPSGIPVRRAWLRVRVRDASGKLLFASGEHDASGRLVDARGELLAIERRGGPVEPHRARIERDTEVALFEALMQDRQGRVTWRLLEAASYAKDNRFLPRGWDPEHPDAAATRPHGVPLGDEFRDGEASVRYAIALPRDAGELEVEATLLYQPLGARHWEEAQAYDTPELRSLARYLQGRLATEKVAETTLRLR